MSKKFKVPIIIEGKYVIAHSNFTMRDEDVWLVDVPCLVTSNIFLQNNKACMKVRSLITGREYVSPFNPEWMTFYESLQDIEDKCKCWIKEGYEIGGQVEQILNKRYYPNDNSWATDFAGRRFEVHNRNTTIISFPFKDDKYDDFIPGCEQFILVNRDGDIGRCLFEEWRLIPRETVTFFDEDDIL